MRVLIVDDEDINRKVVVVLLSKRGIEVHEAKSGAQSIMMAKVEMYDFILMDIRMPEMSGIELFDRLRALQCRLPVIFLTGHGDVPMAVQALKDGAFDFIEKPFTPERLEGIVAAALASKPALRMLLDMKDAESTMSRLTPRQAEIVDLIAEGLTSKEIALRLGMSFRTVDTHRARIMEKLKVNSLAELLQLRLVAEFSGG